MHDVCQCCTRLANISRFAFNLCKHYSKYIACVMCAYYNHHCSFFNISLPARHNSPLHPSMKSPTRTDF